MISMLKLITDLKSPTAVDEAKLAPETKVLR
jgi:hypothetical protein